MKQIICLSHTPWRSRPNRTQQLLTRLPDAKILFFEPPSRDREQKHKNGLRVRSNILVYPLPVLHWEGVGSLTIRRHNQLRVSNYVEKVMTRHQFVEPALWCTSPEFYYLPDLIAYNRLIYDCSREWTGVSQEREEQLANTADVIFAASQGLAERLSPCSDNIALIPNGANPLMFLRDDLAPPQRIAQLPKPILCRAGDLHADLDLEPLVHAAKWRPQWTFLLLGEVSREASSALSSFPNVVLEGPVPTVDLPDYLSGCDVLFDLRHTRRGGDVVPSRIYEYFSTGKPTVAMSAPEQAAPFLSIAYIAQDSGSFLRCCEDALKENSQKKRLQRIDCARHSSWSIRAGEIAHILNLI